MLSPFVWPWLVVNDRKFLVGTVFFSRTNQPVVNLYEVELMGVELLGGFLERVVPISLGV